MFKLFDSIAIELATLTRNIHTNPQFTKKYSIFNLHPLLILHIPKCNKLSINEYNDNNEFNTNNPCKILRSNSPNEFNKCDVITTK